MLLSAFLIYLIHFAIGDPSAWFPSCGKSKYYDAGEHGLPESFIVGGNEARRHEFPWQVRISYRRDGNVYLCGGSIINDRWILTAAHCLPRRPKDITLYVGDHKRNETSNPYRKIMSAERIFSHPDHVFAYSDIALIKTTETIRFNENVWPICAPEPKDPYVHRKAVVSGWGKTISALQNNASNILMYTTLMTTTNNYCQRRHLTRITSDMICATDNSEDKERSICMGDSGGPLAVKNSNGIFSIIGVSSFVSRKGCAKDSPSVYSRVTYALDWINETIKQ